MEMDSFEYFHYMIFPKHMVFLNKQYHRCDDFLQRFQLDLFDGMDLILVL